jgi:hypothetical protein
MATTPVTQQEIDALDKLIKILANATTRADFKKDADKAAKDAGVDLSSSRIKAAIAHLKDLPDDHLQVIASINDKMFSIGLVESPGSTTMKLSKQV